MYIYHSSLRAIRAANHNGKAPVIEMVSSLCPRFARPLQARASFTQVYNVTFRDQKRLLHSSSTTENASSIANTATSDFRLPLQCPGCGAFTNTNNDDAAGSYSLTRRIVREYLGMEEDVKPTVEDEIVKSALKSVDEKTANVLGLGQALAPTFPSSRDENDVPLCDRCHKLQHHNTGVPIFHPSVESLRETICESPHKYNHIYHIIDAADFPMSILPGIHKLLNLTPQRSMNRRSKSGKYHKGGKTEVSFIITRSDLLAPLKVQVDHMMPYLVQVLRDALGRTAADVRLGNVRCVSSFRGWWVKELKEEIWERGGAGWMVGKVNVGKSQLFHNVFPKGRRGQVERFPTASGLKDQSSVREGDATTRAATSSISALNQQSELPGLVDIESDSLLPPLRPETDYPRMPLVSSLPGTTASALRIPFGSSKGELIDLPGLARSSLENHVQPMYRPSLIMNSRIRPEQIVVKPGQSLLLGGLIRITPVTPDLIFLACAFTPIGVHLTSTEKAIDIQEQSGQGGVLNIAVKGQGKTAKSAGKFELRWDVTKERTGPLMRNDAVGLRAEHLPYKVLGMDILVEGVGWVEIAAQVRKTSMERRRDFEFLRARKSTTTGRKASEGSESQAFAKTAHHQDDLDRTRWKSGHEEEKESSMFSAASANNDTASTQTEATIQTSYPQIEVYSPEGKYIACRQPMNAWLHIATKPDAKKGKARPRKSMKGAKKMLKVATRKYDSGFGGLSTSTGSRIAR